MTDAERTRELLRESGEIIRSLYEDANLEVSTGTEGNAPGAPLEVVMRNLAEVMREIARLDEERSRL